ncbi:MAG: ATP-binding protein [Coriobacteriia bacterium]|nr:ATP-binding protein [Coriobacteriia bacterium]
MTQQDVTVLLVEDNPGDARLIQEFLRESVVSRFRLEVRESLTAGLDRLAEGGIDAVLLDLSLPDSTGLETFRTLHRSFPQAATILLTGADDDESASIAVREGAQDYLVKGVVGGDSIVRSLRYAIERKAADRELEEHRARLEETVDIRTVELTRLNEELSLATLAKSEFLASMSHELRTPLNSIIGFSGVLLQGLAGEVPDEQREQIRMINNAGKHLLSLINDILDLSKIEAGRMEVVPTTFSLDDLVQDTLESVRPLAAERGLALSSEIRGDDAAVCTDSDRLRQIVLNLVGNAVKFTEEGSVVVATDVTDPDVVSVSVMDTGPGIGEDDLERIFEEFVQAPASPTTKGTGLGLPISRRMAALLGGSVGVTSELGRGSTFTVVVPRRRFAECIDDPPVD